MNVWKPAATLLVIASFALALVAPLWTYALSLAAFGMPHVLSELRYVDHRFQQRFPLRRGIALLLMLAAVAGTRALGVGEWLSPRATTITELGLLALAATLFLPELLRAGRLQGAVGLAVIALLLVGCGWAPFTTMVLLAFLHNLTPVGLLAERFRGKLRRRALWLCGLTFGVIPFILASGLLQPLLLDRGWLSGDAWSALGPVESHFGSFVPDPLLQHELALPLFTAAVFLQCMHYAAVLHVLPRSWGREDVYQPTTTGLVRWPQQRLFMVLLVAIGALFFAGFRVAFVDTRLIYSIFAIVHAWVEVPVLLAALSGGALKLRATPAGAA